MNQKIIWLIVGLMSAAVVGVMILQLNFILQNIQLNEEQFDKHVRDALKQVSAKLESVENYQVLKFTNGFSIKRITIDSANGSFSFQQSSYVSSDPSVIQQKMDAMQLKQEMFNSPLEERINVVQLDGFLKNELTERGIDVPFTYGVFSNADSSFVIINNHYTIPTANQAQFAYLRDSEYKTNLFPTDIASPGVLMMHFPTKSRVVWGGMWKTLVMSLLFVAVILSCFGYTISVIFKQKKLSEMKTDFINNMTHEFKTPIATISLAADSITSQQIISNPDKVRRFADIIKQENKRMNGQVEKVLQMALIERDRLKLNFSQVDLHEVIQQAVANISLQVEKKEGVVAAKFNADRPIVEGDSNHISNVINNLLDNANKYSPEKPDIMVSTRNVSNGVEITVSDKGIGMTKEAKKKIFEKFYRVHTGNLHDVKGFGLGLAYVKAMITAHKGSIDVKSELGKGSSFVLFLPFHVQEVRDLS